MSEVQVGWRGGTGTWDSGADATPVGEGIAVEIEVVLDGAPLGAGKARLEDKTPA
jgi:hypothetical protein